MKTIALLFGLFWVGFYFIELLSAIKKANAPTMANIIAGVAAVSIGYYFVG